MRAPADWTLQHPITDSAAVARQQTSYRSDAGTTRFFTRTLSRAVSDAGVRQINGEWSHAQFAPDTQRAVDPGFDSSG
jgi:hypothetical protein